MARDAKLIRRLVLLAITWALLSSCGSDEATERETSRSPGTSLPPCNGEVDLRGFRRSLETRADLEAYVREQRQLLDKLARETPDRPLRAGINLKKLAGQEGIDALVERHDLQWLNIYWDSPSGVHGAMSRSVGPQRLDGLNEGAAAYYLTVEPLPALELKDVANENIVHLVDVGRIDELDEATAGNKCVRFSLPDPLWFRAQSLQISLE